MAGDERMRDKLNEAVRELRTELGVATAAHEQAGQGAGVEGMKRKKRTLRDRLQVRRDRG
jgi:hypothetical protein